MSDDEDIVLNWKKLKTTGRSIGRRTGHSCEIISSVNKLIFFGGHGDRKEYSVLDLESLQWNHKVSPIVCQYHSTSIIKSTEEGAIILLYGGMRNGYDFNQSVFEIHVNREDEIWNERPVIGHKNPGGRWGHTIVTHPDGQTTILFGGWNLTRYWNDVWVYNHTSNLWTETNDGKSDNSPGNRWAYSIVCLEKDEKILLYGGIGDDSYGDLWELSLQTYQWKEIEFKNQNNILPRSDSRMFFIHDSFGNKITERIFLSTGEYDDEELNKQQSYEKVTSFHFLDLIEKEWKPVHSSTEGFTNQYRWYHSNCFVQHEDSLLLLGGYYVTNPMFDSGTVGFPKETGISNNHLEGDILFCKIPGLFMKSSSFQEIEDLRMRVEFLKERFMNDDQNEEREDVEIICMNGSWNSEAFFVLKVLFL